MTTNAQRAFWAHSCLDHFAVLTGADTTEDCAGDLIADIGHLCARDGLDFLAIVKRGIGHWQVERDDEDGLRLDLPPVHILIDVAFTPTGLFHTPADQSELNAWLEQLPPTDGAPLRAITAAMMAWNLACKLINESTAP